MASSSACQSLLALARSFKRVNISDPLTQCLIPRLNRSFATTVDIPIIESVNDNPLIPSQPSTQSPLKTPNVLTTLYNWPTLEPQRFAWYPSEHLHLPMRKDIIHRAVIYEADITRGWSTASTKWRKDVHGSNRKIMPQKGMGKARAGDKKSPSRRGGGVAFGPHPRDFSTELPKKIYDIAWRTALSYRYKRGELIILNEHMTMPFDGTPRLLENIFHANKWGHDNGRSLLVTNRVDRLKIKSQEDRNLAEMQDRLFDSMAEIGSHGTIKDLSNVKVKDLLETGRVIIEDRTLRLLLKQHSSDLRSRIRQVV